MEYIQIGGKASATGRFEMEARASGRAQSIPSTMHINLKRMHLARLFYQRPQHWLNTWAHRTLHNIVHRCAIHLTYADQCRQCVITRRHMSGVCVVEHIYGSQFIKMCIPIGLWCAVSTQRKAFQRNYGCGITASKRTHEFQWNFVPFFQPHADARLG